MRKLVLSQRLELLVDALAEELCCAKPLQKSGILVPPGAMRGWLQLELAKRGIVAGYRFITAAGWVRSLGKVATSLEIAAAVYVEVGEVALAEHVARLFEDYGEVAPELFEEQGEGWQRELLAKVFAKCRAPVQVLEECGVPRGPLYCFGVDWLPRRYWECLCRVEELRVYGFSPCIHFWEDVCSNWEKRRLLQDEHQELELYLDEAPLPLANWGRLGRDTLKALEPLEVEERYEQCKAALHLGQVQRAVLEFEKGGAWAEDGSIKVLQAGISRLREVEVLCEEIVEVAGRGVPFAEIGVLACDLGSYAPLMELLFGRYGIPYRMMGVEVQSPFWQGVRKLLAGELWEAPVCAVKMGWDREALEKVHAWAEVARYRGVGALWEALVVLEPGQVLRIEMGDAELLEQFVSMWEALEAREKEKTLGEWAAWLEEMAGRFLGGEEEEAFQQMVRELRGVGGEATFPLQWIERWVRRPQFGEIHPHELHGVRVAPFSDGNVTSYRALFLLGMDGESFPRQRAASSLDLAKGAPDFAERDRYLFLRVLFAAKELLCISYRHLEGDKARDVSGVVEELMQFAKIAPRTIAGRTVAHKTRVSIKSTPHRSTSSENRVVSIQELASLARHPWRFYLRKKLGIWLQGEASLGQKKAMWLREVLDKSVEEIVQHLPPGLIGEAIALEVKEKAVDWKRPMFTAAWMESCRAMRWIDTTRVELPCLTIGQVRIVGEVRHLTQEALVIPHDDSLPSLLKVWPEWLCAAVGLGVRRVECAKSGKAKEIEGPEQWLTQFLEYFFLAEEQLSPLLPEWADAWLRGGQQKPLRFQDPVVDWVLGRLSPEFEEEWAPFLQGALGGLAALFPRRGHAKI